MREIVCCVLATVLLGSTMLESRVNAALAVSFGKEATEQQKTMKERILEVPPGAMIEVRLLNKKKMRGRLGEINNEGFNLTTVQGDKILKEQIAFTNLKSFKKVEGNKAGHAVLYALAGVGVFLVIMIIWAAAETS
jgi:hypothetical protein